MSAPTEYPSTCNFCGGLVIDVMDYLENHLEKHFPVAKAQYISYEENRNS